MEGRSRSDGWLAATEKNGFIARHHLRALGVDSESLDRAPVIGISNTRSDLTPCNSNLDSLASRVRDGILRAGGLPLEFPSFSIGEPFMRPSSMLYRNLAAMEIEEQIVANPLDAVVLLAGCDKTTPAALMAAASANVPAIVLTSGPMLNGKFRGKDVGSGTDIWRITEEVNAGARPEADLRELECSLNRSAGHCMTMGTASTMACLAEALGMMLPGTAAIPASDSRRLVAAFETGRTAVRLAIEGVRPSQIMDDRSLRNAIRILTAVGGSTNAVLHLLAIAGRLGHDLRLDDFDRIGREVPLLVDLQPAGRFLMEEFAYAGGLPAVISRMTDLLEEGGITVAGPGILESANDLTYIDDEVVRPLSNPVRPPGSEIAVLTGNLAPQGAVIKQAAATPSLMRHVGPALVFDSVEDYYDSKDDLSLPVTEDTVLIVRNCGPRGYPGMPEVGNFALPRVMLEAGVRDMVRISDARMSGTAYGTCILHVAPEAAVGGPLSLVRSGDLVELDVDRRSLNVLVSDEELETRRAAGAAPARAEGRGWARIYTDHVMQANTGADLDILVGNTIDEGPRRRAF